MADTRTRRFAWAATVVASLACSPANAIADDQEQANEREAIEGAIEQRRSPTQPMSNHALLLAI